MSCDGLGCNFCDGVVMVNTLTQWLIGISVLLAIMLMMVAGWRLLTSGGDRSAYEGAKKLLYNAIIGFVIILAAWTIVDTFFKVLTNDETQQSAFGMWNPVQCGGMVNQETGTPTGIDLAEAVPAFYGNTNNLTEAEYRELGFSVHACNAYAGADSSLCLEHCTTAYPGSDVRTGQQLGHYGNYNSFCVVPPAGSTNTAAPAAPASSGGPGLTHGEALSRLSSHDIVVVSSGNCSNRNQGSCTSLDGVQQTSVDRVIWLQQQIGGRVTVTGGTETGHASGQYSHGNGYKIDIRTDSHINDYITNNFTSLGGNRYRDPHGNIYHRHGPVDHWDITITN